MYAYIDQLRADFDFLDGMTSMVKGYHEQASSFTLRELRVARELSLGGRVAYESSKGRNTSRSNSSDSVPHLFLRATA